MMHFFLILSSFLQQSESLRLRDHGEHYPNSDESVRLHGYDAYDIYGSSDQYGYYGSQCESDDWCSFELVCIEKQCVQNPAIEINHSEIHHSIGLYEPKSDAEKKRMEEEDKKFKQCIEKLEEHEEEKKLEEDEETDWFNILAAGMRRRFEHEREEWILHSGDDMNLLLSTIPPLRSRFEKSLKVGNLKNYLRCNKWASEDPNPQALGRLLFSHYKIAGVTIGDIRDEEVRDETAEKIWEKIMDKEHFDDAMNFAHSILIASEKLIENPTDSLSSFIETSFHSIEKVATDPDQIKLGVASWLNYFGQQLTDPENHGEVVSHFVEEDLIGSLSFINRFAVQRIIKNKLKKKWPELADSKSGEFAIDLFSNGFLGNIWEQVGETAAHWVTSHLGFAVEHVAHHGFIHAVSHAAGVKAVAGAAAVFGGHGTLAAFTLAAAPVIATAAVHTILVTLPVIGLKYFIKWGVGKYCESVKDEKYESLVLKYMCGFSNTEDPELLAKARREMIEANEANRKTYVQIWERSGYADNNDFGNFIYDDSEVVEASWLQAMLQHDLYGSYNYVSQEQQETDRRWKAQQEILKEKRDVAMDAYNYLEDDSNFNFNAKGREAREEERQREEEKEKQREEERAQLFGKRPETGELDHPGWDQGHWC